MKAIIFIPGYKGSALKNERTGKREWMRSESLLGGKSNLKLPMEKEENELKSDGIFKGVELTKRLNLLDIYGDIVRDIHKENKNGYVVKVFDYDWRLSLIDNVKKLSAFVNEIKNEGCDDIRFVAHSMGGCILSYYLRYGTVLPEDNPEPQWPEIKGISRAIYCAVPFLGTMRTVIYTHVGNPLLFNKQILDCETTLSFLSAYEMLPAYEADVLKYKDNDEKIDLFSIDSWRKNKLGYFGYDRYKNDDKYILFTKDCIRRGKIIAELLNKKRSDNEPCQVKIINMYSTAVPTLNYAYIEQTEGRPIIEYKKRDELLSGGDGLVCEKSGKYPQKEYPSLNEIECSFSHKGLFKDKKIRNMIMKFVTDRE